MRTIVGRDRRRPEPGEVLDAGRDPGLRQTARERDAELGGTEVARAERPVGSVEHRCEIDVDALATERQASLTAGRERFRSGPKARGSLPRRELGIRLHRPAFLVRDRERALGP
jgi:hypothetical protein